MSVDSNEGTFELDPQVYDQLVNWSRRLEREEPFFRRLFETHGVGRVLDLACGTGHHAQLFADWGHVVHGIDGSPAMIDYCRRVHGESPQLQWSCARLEALPEFDGDFDAIVCLGNSLSMLARAAAVGDVIRNAAERLSSGGILVTHTLNVERLPEGPIIWQKARQVSAGGSGRYVVKGVHRVGGQAYIDVADAPLDGEDDFSRCRSTPVLSLTPELLREACVAGGLEEVEFYGDHGFADFDANRSANLLTVAARGSG